MNIEIMSARGGKTKNKLAIFFSCIALMFFVGNFSVKAADDVSTCGSNDKGTCTEGSFSCPDGMEHLTGGRDCANGYRCCIEEDPGNTSKSLLGETCGAGESGRCMEASMMMCPSGYSSVSGGSDCSGMNVKCCARDNSTTTYKEECAKDGKVYNVDKMECEKASDPGGGSSLGEVKPLGKIDIPTDLGLPNNTVAGVLKNLLSWLLGIVGILALIGFLVSGIQYLLAYSNEDLAETAKKNMTYSILGITVALSGFILIQAVNLALQGTPWF